MNSALHSVRPLRVAGKLLAAALITTATGGVATAQSWPSKTVTVIVPLGPGNALESIGRPVLEQLSQRLGQSFIIENRAGAGTMTGSAYAARAQPDGHTILFQSSTLAIVHTVYANRPYDTLADLTPVVPLGAQPTLLVTAASKGYKSAKDLIAAAKANPGSMNFASAGQGSTSHIAAERFRRSAGIDAKHVPFRAPSEGLTETLTGRIDYYFPPISVALPLVNDGKLVPLAVSTKARSMALPNVPTSTELGLKDSAFEFWIGFFLPSKTSPEIVARLNKETREILKLPAIEAQVKRFGYQSMDMAPDTFAKFFREDVEDLGKLIKAAGITAGN